MITIFSTPKAFTGHIATIQRNAIKSWTLLHPEIEVILLGDDEGTAETAKEFDVRHIPDVVRNEYGTPLLNYVFDIAQAEAKNHIVTYVNADIILMSDFINAVKQIPEGPFLMAGQRWNLDVQDTVRFDKDDWEERLKNEIDRRGKLSGAGGIDYFVFRRGFWKDIPPFAVGRTAWDNWLIYYSRSVRVPVIDVTEVVTAVHQSHEYSHHPKGFEGVWKGPESLRNMELAGDATKFTLDDATLQLTPRGLRKLKLTANRFYHYIASLPLLKPRFGLLAGIFLFLLNSLLKIRNGFRQLY